MCFFFAWACNTRLVSNGSKDTKGNSRQQKVHLASLPLCLTPSLPHSFLNLSHGTVKAAADDYTQFRGPSRRDEGGKRSIRLPPSIHPSFSPSQGKKMDAD